MKKLKLLTIGIMMFLISINGLNAASFNMTSSTRTITPNGSFTINIGGDCIGRVDLSVTNGTLSTNSIWVEQGYISVRVTAGSSGSVTITATPVTGFSDSDANLYNPGSRTISVNISSNASNSSGTNRPSNPTTNKSGDNNLSNITIDNGELSPAFNKDTLEYKINLNKDITKLTINATASDSKAKIEGIGEKNLKPGNNIIEIKVTAENGNIKTYKINAYVDETPEVYIKHKKEEIGIIRNLEGLVIPEGFSEEEYEIENNKITLFNNEHITLIYGLNKNKEKSFYTFDKKTNKIINKITPININNRVIYITDKEIEIKNTKSELIKINETEVNCYTFKENNNYCLLNAVNSNGKNIEYIYEKSENTIQIFPDFLLKEKKNNFNIIIYICIGLILIPIGIIIYLLIKPKKEKNITIKQTKKRGTNHEKTK